MNTITQAKRRLKARLDTHMAALLAAADVEADDEVTTTPPCGVFTRETFGTQEYPCIEMVMQGSHKVPDSTADEYQHRLAITVTLGGDDEETITTQLERYLWVLRKFGQDHIDRDMPDPEDAVDLIICGDESYMPLVRGSGTGVESPWLKGGWIEFFVTTIE